MRAFFLCFIGWAMSLGAASAQDLVSQPVPATAWLDLRPAEEGAPPQSVPPWVTALDVFAVAEIDGTESTLIAIELDPIRAAETSGVLARLVFADLSGARPVIAGVDEKGDVVGEPRYLGEGLGLLTSESCHFEAGVAAIHIEVPGDGSNVMTVFLSLLDEETMLRATDADSLEGPIELFRRTLLPRWSEDDMYLFGRVRAVLSREIVSLEEGDVSIEMELEERPLLGVLRFRINGAEATEPVWVSINGGPARPAAYALPDLADPAYLGVVRGQRDGMAFRYADWLQAEVAIAGTELLGRTTNEVLLILPDDHGPAVIRDVVLELKFNWDKLNYELEP